VVVDGPEQLRRTSGHQISLNLLGDGVYAAGVQTRLPARTEARPRADAHARLATALVFVVFGVLVGVLAARMPAIKQHAGLTDGALGVALLGYSLGSLVTIYLAGRSIARWGSAAVTIGGLIVASLSFPFVPFAASLGPLTVALACAGAGLGLTDAAMNAHAVIVQKRYGRSIMSSFHGCASLGMLIGAGLGAASAHLGMSLAELFVPLDALGVAVALAAYRSLLPRAADLAGVEQARREDEHRTPWSLTLCLLAAVAFLALLTEWAVGNWSAVHLQDDLGAGPAFAAYGYGAFTFAMVCARFLGDGAIRRLGPHGLLRGGGLAVAAAMLAGLIAGNPVVFVLACGAVGVGMAAVVPVIFTAAGDTPGASAGAVSKVIGVGYAGSMVGPPVIGLFAALTSLTTALYVIVASGAVIGVVGPIAVGNARRSVPPV
jgi:predicted MFS family arabinose efflux permease